VLLAASQAPANVQFIYEDDHSDVTTGVTAANKLLSVDNVDMLLGLYNPDEVKAVDPIAKTASKEIFTTNFCDTAFVPLDNVFCGYPGAAGQLATAIPMIKAQNLKKFALEEDEVTLGSGASCQIKLSGMFVGKEHAKIVRTKDGQFKIQHLSGMAGTRVNGEKIAEHVLKHGDEIEVGKQKLLFRLER